MTGKTNAGTGGVSLPELQFPATSLDILIDKETISADGTKLVGSMPNNGAWTGSVGMNGSVTIPAGYHNGSGKISGPSVTQRGAWTGSVGMNGSITIPEGYHNGSGKVSGPSVTQRGAWTARIGINGKAVIPAGYHNGSGYVDQAITVSSVVSFKVAQYSNLTLIASWAKPSKGPWSGLRVMCKQGSYPGSASDGTVFYEGSGTSATKSLAAGTWYFRAWNYLTTSAGRLYGSYQQTTCNNVAIKGQKTFTSSGTFTVPTNVRSVDIFCVGGGGSGGKGGGFRNTAPAGRTQSGSGGGGGRTVTKKSIAVTPGSSLAVTIGGGGASVDTIYTDGKPGGVTKVMSGSTVLISANGGDAGHNPKGSNGGSGSGAGLNWSGYVSKLGGSGGSNGGNGGNGYTDDPNAPPAVGGYGQGSTTRAFGESSGTLYSGGGGGGSHGSNYIASGGAGGGGNGSKIYNRAILTAAASGGGNTGGGGGGTLEGTSGSGGSGICIIRWGY